jgi:hypothetical protein
MFAAVDDHRTLDERDRADAVRPATRLRPEGAGTDIFGLGSVGETLVRHDVEQEPIGGRESDQEI